MEIYIFLPGTTQNPYMHPWGSPNPTLRTTNVMSFVALEELYHVCRQVLDFGSDTQSLEQKVVFHLGFIIYNNIYQKKGGLTKQAIGCILQGEGSCIFGKYGSYNTVITLFKCTYKKFRLDRNREVLTLLTFSAQTTWQIAVWRCNECQIVIFGKLKKWSEAEPQFQHSVCLHAQ